jgi:hypothetical protein
MAGFEPAFSVSPADAMTTLPGLLYFLYLLKMLLPTD